MHIHLSLLVNYMWPQICPIYLKISNHYTITTLPCMAMIISKMHTKPQVLCYITPTYIKHNFLSTIQWQFANFYGHRIICDTLKYKRLLPNAICLADTQLRAGWQKYQFSVDIWKYKHIKDNILIPDPYMEIYIFTFAKMLLNQYKLYQKTFHPSIVKNVSISGRKWYRENRCWRD